MIALESKTPGDAISVERMNDLVNQLALAKSRQDIDAAMEIYHPACTLVTPPFNSVATGPEIRSRLEIFFRNFPDYTVDIKGQVAHDRMLVSWGEIGMTLSTKLNGCTPNGRRAILPVFIFFAFKDDRILWESFNFDLGSLCFQSGVPLGAFSTT